MAMRLQTAWKGPRSKTWACGGQTAIISVYNRSDVGGGIDGTAATSAQANSPQLRLRGYSKGRLTRRN
jgi:hypothetical protein